MIVGDPTLRSGQNGQRQLCHRCEANIEQNPFGGAPCTGGDTFAMPTGTCGGGIRATITFPTYVIHRIPPPSLGWPSDLLTLRNTRADAGTARMSTARTTSPTSHTPAAAPSSPRARVRPPIRSSSRRSCTRSCGTRGSSTTRPTGRWTGPSLSSTAWETSEPAPAALACVGSFFFFFFLGKPY